MTEPTANFTGPQRIRDAAVRGTGAQLTAAQVLQLFHLEDLRYAAHEDDRIATDGLPKLLKDLDPEGGPDDA
jgi:hypothetical protein